MKSSDVVIIGAGAAGLMCAIEAAKRGRTVRVIERSAKPAEKIRISGGGRCNFTNTDVRPENYLSQNPHFCKSALRRYTPADFIALIEAHGIAYHEKTLGQLFCDGSARQIIDMLLGECRKWGAELVLEAEVTGITKGETGFRLETDNGAFACQSLVVATGGPSIPKMGATGFGYDIARQFGLGVVPPRPALVPFTLTGKALEAAQALAGVSADVAVSCGATSFHEAMLFTHRGLSGPAMLQISSYWQPGEALLVDFAPGRNLYDELVTTRKATPATTLVQVLSGFLPKRLARFLCGEASANTRLGELSNARLRAAADAVHSWQITPCGTEGYRTAEVTLGGVDTNELSSKTFEAKKVCGLFFIGEVVDVTGHLGGYNFQWAWASGHAAGHYV